MPAPAQESLAAQAPRSAAALAAALHQAARAGQLADLEALLQQGAPLNAPDGAGRTALSLAVIHGHSALVRRLLALGANPALVDSDGLDALQHARRLGREDMVRLIEART
jgi:ankyrin repeat protein